MADNLRSQHQLCPISEPFPMWMERDEDELVIARGEETDRLPLGEEGGPHVLVTAQCEAAGQDTHPFATLLVVLDEQRNVLAEQCQLRPHRESGWDLTEVRSFARAWGLEHEDYGFMGSQQDLRRRLPGAKGIPSQLSFTPKTFGRSGLSMLVLILLLIALPIPAAWILGEMGSRHRVVDVLIILALALLVVSWWAVVMWLQPTRRPPACPIHRKQSTVIMETEPPTATWIGVDRGELCLFDTGDRRIVMGSMTRDELELRLAGDQVWAVDHRRGPLLRLEGRFDPDDVRRFSSATGLPTQWGAAATVSESGDVPVVKASGLSALRHRAATVVALRATVAAVLLLLLGWWMTRQFSSAWLCLLLAIVGVVAYYVIVDRFLRQAASTHPQPPSYPPVPEPGRPS
ncbi:MAG: hypothetical protein GEU93_10925 [Propionibacteriales bacterium]|nr:hypothetical protein [Propionibacteriales bacterium]